MATSSIFANFNITDKETAEAFANALAESAADGPYQPQTDRSVRLATPEEIEAFVARRKKRLQDEMGNN